MKMVDRISHLISRSNWSLLGFVLAAIIGAVSIYTEFYRDTRPREILSRVVDRFPESGSVPLLLA